MNKCSICDNTENLNYIPIYKGGFGKGEVHYDGGIYLCDECLSICTKCSKCGKIIPSKVMEIVLDGWEHSFCQCEETDIERQKRYELEEINYNFLQNKKKIEKIKKSYLKQQARKFEDIVCTLHKDDIPDKICIVNDKKYILDCYLASFFNMTTKELRSVIKKNFELFSTNDLYVFNDNEIADLQEEFENYNTSVNPYGFSITGLIKIATLLNNDIAKTLIDDCIKSLLENKIFYSKNENIQILFDQLSNNRFLSDNKKLQEKYLNNIIEEIKELKNEKEQYQQKISNFTATIYFLISIIFLFVLYVLKII